MTVDDENADQCYPSLSSYSATNHQSFITSLSDERSAPNKISYLDLVAGRLLKEEGSYFFVSLHWHMHHAAGGQGEDLENITRLLRVPL